MMRVMAGFRRGQGQGGVRPFLTPPPPVGTAPLRIARPLWRKVGGMKTGHDWRTPSGFLLLVRFGGSDQRVRTGMICFLRLMTPGRTTVSPVTVTPKLFSTNI